MKRSPIVLECGDVFGRLTVEIALTAPIDRSTNRKEFSRARTAASQQN